MATVSVGVLEAILRLNDQLSPELKKSLREIDKVASGLAGRLGPVGKALSALGPAGVAAAAGIAAVTVAGAAVAKVLFDATSKAAAFGARFQEISENTAVSAETLQAIAGSKGFGMERVEEFAAGIKRLNIELIKSPAQFEQLGLSASKLLAMKPEERFAAVANSILRLGSDAERTAATQELLGKSMPIAALRDFADVQERMSRARGLGLTLDDATTASLKDMADEAQQLSAVWDALWIQIGAAIATSPGVQDAVRGIADGLGALVMWIKGNKDEIQSFVGVVQSVAVPALALMRLALENTAAGAKVLVDQMSSAVRGAKALVGVLPAGLVASVRGGVGMLGGGAGSQRGSISNVVPESKKTDKPVWDPERLERLRKAQEEAAREAKKFQEAIDKLSGATAAKEMALLERQIAAIGGVSKIQEGQMKGFLKNFKDLQDDGAKATGVLKDFQILQTRVISTKPLLSATQDAKDRFGLRELDNVIDPALGLWTRYADVVDAELKRASDAGTKHAKATIDWAGGLDVLANAFQLLGISAESSLARAVVGLQAGMAAAQQLQKMLSDPNATQGQKGMAIGMGAINTALTAYRSGVAGGAAAGAAFGSSFGPIGTAIGAVAGGLLGFIGKAKRLREELRKMKDDFVASMGGMAALQQKAKDAGVSLDAMFKAKNAQQLEAAIKGIKSSLDTWDEAHQKVNAAIEKYGFTIEELGPKFQQQRLDEMAAGLMEDYALLIASGIENNTVIEKMGPAFNEYVQTAIRAGAALPKSMEPVIQQLIATGQLVDENGNAFESAEAAGISFTESLTEGLSRAVDAIERLVAALTGVRSPGPINIPVTTDGNMPVPRDLPNFQHGSGGFRDFGAGTPAMLHGVEAVVPRDRGHGGGIGQSVTITYAPTLTVQGAGNDAEIRRTVQDALRNDADGLASRIRDMVRP
jgi:hypothetical protein